MNVTLSLCKATDVSVAKKPNFNKISPIDAPYFGILLCIRHIYKTKLHAEPTWLQVMISVISVFQTFLLFRRVNIMPCIHYARVVDQVMLSHETIFLLQCKSAKWKTLHPRSLGSTELKIWNFL